MARQTVGTGETVVVGGVTDIFGTSGTQSIIVVAPSGGFDGDHLPQRLQQWLC